MCDVIGEVIVVVLDVVDRVTELVEPTVVVLVVTNAHTRTNKTHIVNDELIQLSQSNCLILVFKRLLTFASPSALAPRVIELRIAKKSTLVVPSTANSAATAFAIFRGNTALWAHWSSHAIVFVTCKHRM